MTHPYSFSPIGEVRSCFPEKFGIPRQPGLVPSATGEIILFEAFGPPESVRELESFSHLWVIFVFHCHVSAGWKPTVRPPRLGGNRRVGVYATRSTFRPNPIGLSVVKLEGIRQENGRICIQISGGDFVDQTPVLDLKPYLPYADALGDAAGGFAPNRPEPRFSVVFSPEAETVCKACVEMGKQDPRPLICEVLALDPRPAYAGKRKGPFGMRLAGMNIRWEVEDTVATVTELEPDSGADEKTGAPFA